MTSSEGIIRFNLSYNKTGAVNENWIVRIQPWRHILFRLNLIGQSPDKYDGYGYGNISERQTPDGGQGGRRLFVITGSQTGHLPELSANHYALVSGWSLENNTIVSQGPLRPSSESLTHAAVYEADAFINAVIHIHCPTLWHRAAKLGLPTTSATIGCGTPEMAREVLCLLKDPECRNLGIFSMGGHQDGIIGFGSDVMEAGLKLIRFLALP